MNSPWRAREKTFTLIIPHPLRERSQLLTKYEFYNCGYGVSYILLLLINPTPEFLSSHCSLRNSIPTCLGLFGYPVPLVRYANSICYRSLRNYGCYEFRFASLYRKSALKGWGVFASLLKITWFWKTLWWNFIASYALITALVRSTWFELITLFTYSPINFRWKFTQHKKGDTND